MSTTTLNPFRTRRTELRRSMRQIAIEVGVATESVWRWENGTSVPRRRYWVELASSYQVPIETISEWVQLVSTELAIKGAA